MRKLDVLKLELLQERMKELDEQRSEIVEEILRLEQQLIKALEKDAKTLNTR
jgi:chaperonin cofactor prefoldin